MATTRTAKTAESFDGTLIEAKKIIDSYTAQLEALEARIIPLEQVIAVRDQQIKDLKVEMMDQKQLKTALEREKLINSDLRAKVDRLTADLQVIGSIAKSWIVQAKTIRAIVKDHG